MDNDSLVTIPIVIHVIFGDEDQNVDDERLLGQIRRLNEDFRRLNPDTALTPALFKDVAADTKVEFCLAEIDPWSESTKGITRTQTFVNEIGLTQRYWQSALGGQDAWDQNRYLNIWVCEIVEDGSIAGFAEAAKMEPAGAEGIVIDYRYFGILTSGMSSFGGGRTLTHETGHWLGLSHIWGVETGCAIDDGIEDTPLQLDRYRGCPTYPQQSCGSEDMFMNFMDLTDDACMNLFTEGQKERMRRVLFTFKPNLWIQDLCENPTTSSLSPDLQRMHLFPNPTRGHLRISLGNLTLNHRIQIRNLQGQMLSYRQLDEGISISDFPPGLYLLTLETGDQSKTFKIIKTD
ncbi:MAG: T9SS type A sorting domain-containing protein [Saprospiraceae bacterium]|nr:T9SS type A sorting domain-containing protein [Saprospiraceae bacterium]